MPLINCKIELKLKWTKYCVLSAAANDDNGNDDDNYFYYQRHTILCSCCHFICKRQSKTVKTS